MRNFLYNRTLSALILPLSLFFSIRSFIRYMYESRKLKKAINSKDERFFKTLLTLNFTGHKIFPSVFYARMAADNTLTPEEIQDIAQKQIVDAVLRYLKSEDLLSYIAVTTDIDNGQVHFELKPATFDLAMSNIFNTIISICITCTIYGLYLLFT